MGGRMAVESAGDAQLTDLKRFRPLEHYADAFLIQRQMPEARVLDEDWRFECNCAVLFNKLLDLWE